MKERADPPLSGIARTVHGGSGFLFAPSEGLGMGAFQASFGAWIVPVLILLVVVVLTEWGKWWR
jgi:hypothetical protein